MKAAGSTFSCWSTFDCKQRSIYLAYYNVREFQSFRCASDLVSDSGQAGLALSCGLPGRPELFLGYVCVTVHLGSYKVHIALIQGATVLCSCVYCDITK